MEFKRVELNDADILNKYFQLYNDGYNHLSLGLFFGFRRPFNTEYTIIDDTLVMKIKFKSGDTRFCMPVGKNVDKAIRFLIEYTKVNNIKLSFFPISHREIAIFDKYFLYEMKHFDNSGDYIYDANSLKTMFGRKLHGQKNHLNYFLKNYSNCEVFDIDDTNAEELKKFIQDIKNIDKEEKSYMYRGELEYNYEVIDNLSIYKYKGIMVKLNSKIIGFILGEEIKETIFFHIMKIDKNYRGIAQYLIVKYLEKCSSNIKYVNMEDDAGDDDLKYTKTCYHPIAMQDVNLLTVKEVKEGV